MAEPLGVLCARRQPSDLEGPRIFVFGCARSGTTLTTNMFRTFDGVTVWDGEHCLNTLAAAPGNGWIVAKRTWRCGLHLGDDMPFLRKLWIVDIIRDPRDVITSASPLRQRTGYHCGFERWQRDVEAVNSLIGRHLRIIQTSLRGVGESTRYNPAGHRGNPWLVDCYYLLTVSSEGPRLTEYVGHACARRRSGAGNESNRTLDATRTPDSNTSRIEEISSYGDTCGPLWLYRGSQPIVKRICWLAEDTFLDR